MTGALFLLFKGKEGSKATVFVAINYWYHYRHSANIMTWLYSCAGFIFVVLTILTVWIFAPAKRSLFGDARFATRKEVEKAGLFGEAGIILGKIGNKFIMFAGTQHVMVSAPTRAWKGISVVITNLLSWRDSVICADMKQENFDKTSAYRKKRGHKVFLFNPVARDYLTHRYNPLGYVSTDKNFRVDDIQKVGGIFFPDVQGTDPIWTATPRSLFLGIVLFLLETPGKLVTIGQVLRETLVDGDGSEYFKNLIDERAEQGNPLSRSCIDALNTYITIKADGTRSGIITSFRSRLELWSNPIIDAATSDNDFDLTKLRKERMSVFVGITPDNLERIQPLVNIFFQQAIDLNIRVLPNKDKSLKFKCLFLMDELTAFGKLNILSKGVSFLAGYGLRILTIIQSPSQSADTYGDAAAENFGTNHAAHVIFAPKKTEQKLAQQISEMLGYQTVDGVSVSGEKGIFKIFKSRRSKTENVSDAKRALLLPQEITDIGQKNSIIIMEHMHPIRAEKAVYFKNHLFIDRLKEVSPTLAKLKGKLPTEAQLDEVTERGELRSDVRKLDMDAHWHSINSEANSYVPKKKSDTEESSVGKTTIKERAFAASDMAGIDKMTLVDFALDFSAVPEIPPGDVDVEKLMKYADSLCAAANVNIL